ncbi:MAG: GIY-YIG nuclease family protein [Melioribacteraceae bacterium]
MFYYVYVLQSAKDKNFYVGYTNNIKRRIEEHNSGHVESTKNRIPFKLRVVPKTIFCKNLTQRTQRIRKVRREY